MIYLTGDTHRNGSIRSRTGRIMSGGTAGIIIAARKQTEL